MKPWGVPKKAKEEILAAYLAGEKIAAISARFGVWLRYAPQLARLRGIPRRKPGRPRGSCSF